MATIQPFRAYRYTAQAGDPATLVTQPSDKISPEMRDRYLAASPYNLVRVILGERLDSDDASNNVYTRAARYLDDWIRDGILSQDPEPGLYAYFQEFEIPDTRERAVRQGFVGIGKVEDYSANVVYRHEQTLSGPKKDRLELLRHTHGHFGQIFMLYPDREGVVDTELSSAAQGSPLMDVLDDYRARHRVWAITDASRIAAIQRAMAPMKLLIADGHHRYETALAYRNENPGNPAAQFVMMTFVNMYSPGLRILATHRVLRNLDRFDADLFIANVQPVWTARACGSVSELKAAMQTQKPETVRIGVVTRRAMHLLERPRNNGELDVPVLHHEILQTLLGIGEEAVRDEKYIHYFRGADAAAAEVLEKNAQAAFLLEPTPMDEMARIAFGGGVMPQKSTDFYPKLLSGITIYRV